ncbi:copper resistance CopC family protein [Micromonospora taraxaci]|uniref:copper resistance CopC family protein n=1 Tax=Micromonospora taraxaci TaxID=1316803 RepID=UPI0033F226F1
MGGRVTRTARVVPVVLGVAFGVSFLAPPTPAAAHNSLTGSDPRDGARVATAPARIELRFLAKPAPATTKITVTGPDNVVAGGPPVFDGSRVRVPFKPAAAGLYIVGYQLASSDGHPVKGEVRFTLTTGTAANPSASPSAAGGAAPTAAAGPTASGTSSTTPAATATPAGSPVPAAQESSQSRGWLWTIAAALLVGGLVVGLQRWLRARRR